MNGLPKTFTVDARRWIRGNKHAKHGSKLVSFSGKMCCLGFLGEACGVEKKKMLDVSRPSLVNGETDAYRKFPENPFIRVNDDIDINDKERVAKLRKLFRAEGITVRFKNLPKGRALTKI